MTRTRWIPDGGVGWGPPPLAAPSENGGLYIGGGGSAAVATDVLYSYAAELDELATEFHSCATAVGRIDRGVSAGMLTAAGAPVGVTSAEDALDDAIRLLDDSGAGSRWLSVALTASAEAYGQAEAAAQRAMQSLGAQLGMAFGFTATTVGLALLPWVASAAAVVGGGVLLASIVDPTGARRARERWGRLIDEHRDVLSDPVVVQLVRIGVMSSDDAIGGALHLPPGVVSALGDDGLGLTGVDTAAGMLGTVAGIGGYLRETPVRVVAGPTAAGTPVDGLTGRLDRIPTGAAQIRVDRYIVPGGKDRFEVYISGTRDFSPTATDEPFDLTSDVGAVADGDPGSLRAVKDALDQAGVEPDSPIVITGHSQGGLVAAQVAASGDYDVQGLYTLGAPVAQVEVPETVPWVAVEHTDDIVPALGGMWQDDDAVLLRREAFVDETADVAHAFPAHQLSTYRDTAVMADRSVEPRLVSAGQRMDAVGAPASRVETTYYRAYREGVTTVR